ncbi:hypothetical protein PR048_033074 [Dryococelus australis]|uniref:Uncharacterized protein n=1 Tax=Dryococelus australis TaxID=614101 RepID=A0ABQ9FZ87_9NEOP|nr:hypothetical protein PR048_033074 [Dryococelus australis]
MEKTAERTYKVAKKNQSFYNFEDEINLRELNGIDVGRILYSTNACINIVNHIGKETRKVLVKQIVDSKSKMSIHRRVYSVSQKNMLIVYVRALIEGINQEEQLNLFTDLIELECLTAKGIFSSLMSHLQSLEFNEEFLSEHLISLTCDGAVVMFGSRSGVAKLFKETFPSIVVWYCASHRLEIYTPYTMHLQKMQKSFKVCAQALETQILKVGPILSIRWVASSYNTVGVVWKNYEAMVLHFEEAKEDKTNRIDLLKKISSTKLILDLVLMCDFLQELSEVSPNLQERNFDLYKAHLKVNDLDEVFEKRKTCPGSADRKSLEAAENLKFCVVVLHKKGRLYDPPISPSVQQFSITGLANKYKKKTFYLEKKSGIDSYTFMEFVKYPEKLLHLKNTLHIIPVSSSECERGFSQMNIIVSPDRAALLTETIKNIMFITSFEPSKYVKTWLLRGRHSAIDTNSKSRTKDEEENGGIAKIWRDI